MRTRSRSSITPAKAHCVDYRTFPTPTQVVSDVYNDVYSPGKSEVFEDETSNPSWSSRLVTGSPIVRPCRSRSVELRRQNTAFNWAINDRNSNGSLAWSAYATMNASADVWMGSYYMHPWVQGPDFSGRFDSSFPYQGENLAVVRSRLFQQCLNQLSSSEMLTAVSVAEFKKTLESCKRLGTLVPRMDDFLYRNKHMLFTKNGLIRATGNLATQWLEYRYGFMQLYYDTTSLVKAFGAAGKPRKTVIARRWTNTSFPDSIKWNTTAAYYTQSNYAYRTRRDTVVCGIIAEAECREVAALDAFGLDRPLSTLWELVPFSFIVDWAIGVSDALSAFEGMLIRKVVASWHSHRTDATQRIGMTRKGQTTVESSGYVLDGSAISVAVEDHELIKRYERVANPSLLVGVLPQISLRLNWKRCADTAALLRGLRNNSIGRL